MKGIKMTGVELIARERRRQIENDNSRAWHRDIFKTKNSDRIAALVRAGVVIAEEIDRLLAKAGDKSDRKETVSMPNIISGLDQNIAERKAQDSSAINPFHYSRWEIEPLDFITANNLDFLRGNIIKYIMRYDAKGGLEDLKKARVYLDRLIEKIEA